MKKALIAISLLMCLFLGGCANIDSGIVYDKEHIPAHSEVYNQTVWLNGNMRLMPTVKYVPDSYRIFIKNDEGETAHYYVTEEEYNSLQIGSWWQVK